MKKQRGMSGKSKSKPPSESQVILEMTQYDEKDYAVYSDLPVEELIKKVKPGLVNWINLDGLHNKDIIDQLGAHFCFDPLLIEEITTEGRPKFEEYEGYIFFTMKMLYRIEGKHIEYEQISFVLGKDYLVTFQEKPGDMFGPIRDRIKQSLGRLRRRRPDYLMYRLIDTVVDNYNMVLDTIGQQIEDSEEDVYGEPSKYEFQHIQAIKKELIFLRKALLPLRDALGNLVQDESG